MSHTLRTFEDIYLRSSAAKRGGKKGCMID
jgi:hypothetical protein